MTWQDLELLIVCGSAFVEVIDPEEMKSVFVFTMPPSPVCMLRYLQLVSDPFRFGPVLFFSLRPAV